MTETYRINDCYRVPCKPTVTKINSTFLLVKYVFPEVTGNTLIIDMYTDDTGLDLIVPRSCYGISKGSFTIVDGVMNGNYDITDNHPNLMDARGVSLTALEADSEFFCLYAPNNTFTNWSNTILATDGLFTIPINSHYCVITGDVVIVDGLVPIAELVADFATLPIPIKCTSTNAVISIIS